MREIGAAIVGAGFMGRVHTEALRRLGVSVRGICGVDAAESASAAEMLELDRAYESFDEVLADEGAAVVHLAVPNRLHFEMARRALEAGKHVLCEKPLAMTSAESAELVELAASHPNQAAGVNYNCRYYPLCLDVRERIAAGELGEVVHVTGSYSQDWLCLETDYNWRVLADEGGEMRAVADIGTHWLDLVAFMTALDVQAVCADLWTVYPVRRRPLGEVETFQSKEQASADTEPVEVTTEDYGCVMLRFRGGGRGCMWVSQVAPGRKNCIRIEITGSQRSYAWNSERPNDLWVGRRDGPNEAVIRDPSLAAPGARWAMDHPGGHNEGYPDSFKQCFRAFYSTIAAGDFAAAEPFPTFADGHREIVLCEAILASHRGGGWVEIEGETP